MAEAEGRILKNGEKIDDFRRSYLGIEPILDPHKHFALMFGVSQDYAYMARVGHGHFLDWLGREFQWSEWTARNYLRVAETFKSGTVTDLPAQCGAQDRSMPASSGSRPLPLGGHSTQWPPPLVPEEREDAAVPVVAPLEPRLAPPPLVDMPDPAPLEVAPAVPPAVPVVVVVVVVVVVPAAVDVPVVDADEFCSVGSDTAPPPAG
jgi:hypothetical protein